jgi:hypothetical protein
VRSLPRVVSQIPNDLRQFLEKVREYISNTGDNQFVTKGDLLRGGIISTTPGGQIIPPEQYVVDTPRVPTGLATSGALATIILTWDEPNYRGHARTEIWAADTNDFDAKELIGTAEGTVFSHSVGSGATKYYWIRFVNSLDVVGPFNSTTGTVGVTGQDPDYLIEVLSDAYGVTGDAPFFQIDTPTVINGVTIPAGTYIKQAWIADATISRAKIQDLAVDNAKISDLSAAKITAGSLQVGSYIQSSNYSAGNTGWKIDASGSAEFQNATVRGTVFATTGQFKGILLGRDATDYSTGIGFYSGGDSTAYRWRVGNPAGARIQWNGTAIEVYNGSNQLTMTSGGIDASYVTGLGTLATQNSVNWNTQITNIPSFGNFAYLNSITSANISTYISSAAIGTAYIANGAITNALIETAAITSAKIGNLEVDTINIKGNAVTQSVSGFNASTVYPLNVGTEYTVATTTTLTIPQYSDAVAITYSLFFFNDLGSGRDLFVYIKRNGTTIETIYPRVKANTDIVITRMYLDTSPGSSASYSVVILLNDSGTNYNFSVPANKGLITAELFKR